MVLEIRLARTANGPVRTIPLPVNINTVSWRSFTEALKREYLGSDTAVIDHLILIDAEGDEASGRLKDITRFKKFLQTKCGPGTFFVVAVEGEIAPGTTGSSAESALATAAGNHSPLAYSPIVTHPPTAAAQGSAVHVRGDSSSWTESSANSSTISQGGTLPVQHDISYRGGAFSRSSSGDSEPRSPAADTGRQPSPADSSGGKAPLHPTALSTRTAIGGESSAAAESPGSAMGNIRSALDSISISKEAHGAQETSSRSRPPVSPAGRAHASLLSGDKASGPGSDGYVAARVAGSSGGLSHEGLRPAAAASNSSPPAQLASARLMSRFGMTAPSNGEAAAVHTRVVVPAPQTEPYGRGSALSPRSDASPIDIGPSTRKETATQHTAYSGRGSRSRSKETDDTHEGVSLRAPSPPQERQGIDERPISPAVSPPAPAPVEPKQSLPKKEQEDDEEQEVSILIKLGGRISAVSLTPGCPWGDIEYRIAQAFGLPATFEVEKMNLMDSGDENAFSEVTTDKRFWKAFKIRYSDEPGMYFLAHQEEDEVDRDDSDADEPAEPEPETAPKSPELNSSVFQQDNGRLTPVVVISSDEFRRPSADDLPSPVRIADVRSDESNQASARPWERAHEKARSTGQSAQDGLRDSGESVRHDRKVKTTIVHGIPNHSDGSGGFVSGGGGGAVNSKNRNVGANRHEDSRIVSHRNTFDYNSSSEPGVAPRKITEFLQACGNGDMPQILSFVRSQSHPFAVKDGEGLTALHVSALRGQLEVVKYILSTAEETRAAGGSYCAMELCLATDNYLMTPLHYACEHDNLHVAQMLLKYGANVCARNSSGSTPLHVICLRGATSMLGLIGESNVNVATDSGLTLLHCAADQGHTEVCKGLVHMPGISVNSRDDTGLTPLHYACIAGHVEVAQLLVDHGAYCNPRDDDGMTPLLYAAQRGQLRTLLWSISVGANIYARDDWGCTALHLACESGHISVVKVLHEKKMDLNARNMEGSTPLELASIEGHDTVVVWMEDHGAWMRPETEAQAHMRRQVDNKAEAATRAFEAEEEANLISGGLCCKCNVISDVKASHAQTQDSLSRKNSYAWFSKS